jgi:hypothetical protein
MLRFGEQLSFLDNQTVAGISCRMNKHVSVAPAANRKGHFHLVDGKRNRLILQEVPLTEARTMERYLNNKSEVDYERWFKTFTEAYDRSHAEWNNNSENI